MTENEREEILRDVRDGYIDDWDNLTVDELFKEIEKEHKEIQQYRAIGTIEEFKALKEKSEPKKADGIENAIPYGTKIIYHGQNGWENCKCYCGHYNKEDDTYDIFRGWDLVHVPKANIEVFDW